MLTGSLFAWLRCTSMLSQSCALAHSLLPIFARLTSQTNLCVTKDNIVTKNPALPFLQATTILIGRTKCVLIEAWYCAVYE